MSFHPADLVSDADLRDYENAILTSFGQTSWQSKRTKALEDWLFPVLKGRGFDPYRLTTRADPDLVLAFTASAFVDKTAACRDTTSDDLDLATIFAAPTTDVLYIGSEQPFRGVFLAQLDSVSSAAGVLSVAYWNGAWEPLTIADGTRKVSSKTLSGGGAVSWILPGGDWQRRALSTSGRLYWAKVTVSAVPTGARAGQLGVIRSSVLRAPATFRTLQLIFAEAPTGQEGPWADKAEFYKNEAAAALERALLSVGEEFDSDGSDQTSDEEQQQTTEQVAEGWSLERA